MDYFALTMAIALQQQAWSVAGHFFPHARKACPARRDEAPCQPNARQTTLGSVESTGRLLDVADPCS